MQIAANPYNKPMLNLFVVRHGQDQDNANGILNGHRNQPLTKKGQEQAAELADGIVRLGLHFDDVYTSPLQRAHKTAEIIAQQLGAPAPHVLPGLIERDFGVMAGRPIADITRLCAPDILRTDTITYFLSPEGAETFPQLKARAQTVLQEVKRLHTSGNILLVTHGDMGKMLYAAFYDLPWRAVLEQFHFGNSELLELSINRGAEQAHRIRIEQHNL